MPWPAPRHPPLLRNLNKELIVTISIVERLYGTQHLMRKIDTGDEVLPTTREALSSIFRVAWPSVVEAVLISLISLIDTAMVSVLGTEAVAAVGLSNQPRFLFLAVFMSLNTGITAIVSRRKGENDPERANRTLRQILVITAGLSLILSVIGVTFARDILLFIGAEADAIEAATTYTQIVIGGLFFNALSININAAQRGCGNTRVSMWANIIGNLFNMLFNFLLIEGRFGFPALGVAGAAIATAMSFFVSFIISLRSVIFSKDGFLKLSFKKSFRPDKQTLFPLLKVASSAAVEQVFMRIGFMVFAIIIARLGTMAYATHQICMNYQNIAFSFGDGMAIATASLLGQSLGRKQPGTARLYGRLAQRLGLTVGAILFIGFISLRRVLILPFTEDPAIIALGSRLLIVLAFNVPAQISQMIFSTNLRVAGDTRYVAVTSLLCITFVRTISAYILCYPLGLGLIGAWLGLVCDQYLRLTLNGRRFQKGAWTQIKL